jgi:hypothetical protein
MSVLYEMRQMRPDLLDKHQVLIDGGITRGTDVLKALCLGARGVGLGRAFLYGNVWGEVGCTRVVESKSIIGIHVEGRSDDGNDSYARRDRIGDATVGGDRVGTIDS